MKAVLDAVSRLLRGAAIVVVALVLLVEEFGWEPLAAWLGRLARWPPVERLEAAIQRLPPRLGLVLFGVPAVLLFPIKIAALALIEAGHGALGLGVIVLAKVVGTAVVGRLFVLLEPQLMHFRWFRRALRWWRATKARIGAALRLARLRDWIRARYDGWRAWLRKALR